MCVDLCRIDGSELSGEVTCPANKSYTHRAIFIGSFAERSVIRNVLYSDDTEATIGACTAFGAQIKRDGTTLTVISPVTLGGDRRIDAGNSATTIRIAAGIASLSPAVTTLSGDQSLRGRPMRPVLDALESLGARCTSSEGMPPISVRGRIRGGGVSVRGDVSSQFVSSLLICAPMTDLGMDVEIVGEGGLVSRPYLDATVATMEGFGAAVRTGERYRRYRVEPRRYREAEFTVPPDHSSMALLLSAAVLVGQDIVIRATESCLPQGDRAFLQILGSLGVRTSVGGGSVTVTHCPEKLDGGTFDLSDAPDLLPPLSILALKCGSPIRITNVRHARYKEADRIAAVCGELAKLGVPVEEVEDGMTLGPAKNPRGGVRLEARRDHRLFMAFSIAAMFVGGGCTVTDPGSVSVSYPDFVPEMARLGARIGAGAR